MVDTIADFDDLLGRLAGSLNDSRAPFDHKIVRDYYRQLEVIRTALAAATKLSEQCECGATVGRDCEQGDARVVGGNMGLCWPEQAGPAPSVAGWQILQPAVMLRADHARIVAELQADNDRLRSAFDDEDEKASVHWFGRWVDEKARADALAGVLREASPFIGWSSKPDGLTERIDALLSEAGK